MTRKHFIELAELVKSMYVDEDERRRLASQLAGFCAQFNDRFDRGRFIRACGIKEAA